MGNTKTADLEFTPVEGFCPAPPHLGDDVGELSVAEFDRVVDTRSAARYVGLGSSTLEKWRGLRSDGPPYIKVGHRVLYRVADLDEWLASHRRRSTSDKGQRE